MTGKSLSLLMAIVLATLTGSPAAAEPKSPDWATKDIRVGLVGCDTSHATAFTGILNSHPEWRVRVVAAFPEGSPDMPRASMGRLAKFTDSLTKSKVKIVASMDELLKIVDAVMIESVDGRPHLRQVRPVFKAGKLVFIDKPFTASLTDAREIVKLSKATGAAFFSSSCSRFQPEIARLRAKAGVGKVTRAQGSGPLNFEPHHPDLFWYGIHGVEALYTMLGRGCASVTYKVEKDIEWTTGKWSDGRIGVFRGVKKGKYQPIAKVWGAGGQAESTGGFNYNGLCEEIARFFQTGKAPIDPLETLEIIEFMTAAQLSKDRGGIEVTLEEARKSVGGSASIVAHRGASRDAPENTLAAFELAWRQGADAIEGDFYLTKDNRIVCIHDSTTKRTGGANLVVAKSTLAELRKLDVGKWRGAKWAGQRIPTLEEVLAIVPAGKRILIEIKCGPEIVGVLKKVLDSSRLTRQQTILISFNTKVIAEAKKQLPRYKAFWLTGLRKDKKTGNWASSRQKVLATLKEIGADGLDCQAVPAAIDRSFMSKLRSRGLELHVWTVDDVKTALYFQGIGAGSITTNRPAWLREQLAKRPSKEKMPPKAGAGKQGEAKRETGNGNRER
ncbi:MAG: Gfo/Idh/MocA family oxidoreductase [Phycisphaerae bacterium]|nr:Gfo/Idh/MocA family oxidoreductase [Phycisphaerae bacterium]